MMSLLDSLCDVCDLESIPVELPNGSVIMATKRGTVCLSPNVKLNHVLYVPGLNCSLISIA